MYTEFGVMVVDDEPGSMKHTFRVAALLHGMGWIGGPDHIVTKPWALIPERFAFIRCQPALGAEIVASITVHVRKADAVDPEPAQKMGRPAVSGQAGGGRNLLAMAAIENKGRLAFCQGDTKGIQASDKRGGSPSDTCNLTDLAERTSCFARRPGWGSVATMAHAYSAEPALSAGEGALAARCGRACRSTAGRIVLQWQATSGPGWSGMCIYRMECYRRTLALRGMWLRD